MKLSPDIRGASTNWSRKAWQSLASQSFLTPPDKPFTDGSTELNMYKENTTKTNQENQENQDSPKSRLRLNPQF